MCNIPIPDIYEILKTLGCYILIYSCVYVVFILCLVFFIEIINKKG